RSEAIRTPDGGQLILDWAEDAAGRRHPEPHTRPTVLLLPGLTGSSQAGYLLCLVHRASRAGYRSVVINHRGCRGEELLTPRTFCASNTEDMETAIAHVKRRYPRAPLLAMGVSLGGMQVLNYLGRRGQEAGLAAAMALCPSWDPSASAASLEQPLNALLFNQRLTTSLCQLVSRPHEPSPPRPPASQARTIREFDERYTAQAFGYSSCHEYYEAASPVRQLHPVCVPILCLNASDDPVSPLHGEQGTMGSVGDSPVAGVAVANLSCPGGPAIPVEAAWHQSYVALLVTAQGGHIGFLEGLWPHPSSYMERLFSQFVTAVFE
ncbi:ABHD1 protein, partial [Baryphthengus martii]|nr:ABHD1 protein [Baryphthengus martii]